MSATVRDKLINEVKHLNSEVKEGSEHSPHSVENIDEEYFQFDKLPAQAAKDTLSPDMTVIQYLNDSDYSLACLS